MRDQGTRPMDDLERRRAGDDVAAIDSVDMTPRPRYHETQAAFAARIAALSAELEDRGLVVQQRTELWFTQCACGWCGLRVEDPEVARREYDAHVCAAVNVGQSAVDRAIAETDRSALAKRTQHVIQPTRAPRADETPMAVTLEEDGTEQRMKLLELK